MIADKEVDLSLCPPDPDSVYVARLKDAQKQRPDLKDAFMTAYDQSVVDFTGLSKETDID